MEKHDHTFHWNQRFELESGEALPKFQLHYTTLGKLNHDRSNIVWVCHALTGSSDFTEWWSDLFQEGGTFDPTHHFIICANILGGCYGSTGPLDINPETGKPYYHTFPSLTNRDVVRAFDLLRKELNISKVNTLIGGSLGGQQALEWSIQNPETFENLILLACNGTQSPWVIALNEAQRLAIEADQTWKENSADAGKAGLKSARAIGMLSYRYHETFKTLQAEKENDKIDDFRAASYQRYQGQKLANRFNAFSYWRLTKMMDSHNVGRNRGSAEEALKNITAKTLVIGIDTDILFPVSDQKFLANHIQHAHYIELTSLYAHDGFLVEVEQINNVVKEFYQQKKLSPVLS